VYFKSIVGVTSLEGQGGTYTASISWDGDLTRGVEGLY
jgi:hypothetical protein